MDRAIVLLHTEESCVHGGSESEVPGLSGVEAALRRCAARRIAVGESRRKLFACEQKLIDAAREIAAELYLREIA